MPGNNKNIRGLLFDKDGTLFDYADTWGPLTSRFIAELANGDDLISQRLARVFEFDLEEAVFLKHSRFVAGTPEAAMEGILAILPDLSRDELDLAYHQATIDAELVSSVPLAPLMDTLIVHGFKVGVSTNDSEAAARSQLRSVDIEEKFHFIAGYDSGFGAKPEPGMQKAFCIATQLQPDQVAMVGDSRHDLLSGRAAKMLTVGVLTGIASRDELLPFADVVLDDIGGLIDWLGLPGAQRSD